MRRDHPGAAWGTAARLPNKPGNQKLTPPSSAFAALAKHANATAPQMRADQATWLRSPPCELLTLRISNPISFRHEQPP